jgi:hypothetical protein
VLNTCSYLGTEYNLVSIDDMVGKIGKLGVLPALQRLADTVKSAARDKREFISYPLFNAVRVF